jgi:hypothetical protein
MRLEYSRKCAETLSKNILLRPRSELKVFLGRHLPSPNTIPIFEGFQADWYRGTGGIGITGCHPRNIFGLYIF